MAVPPVRRRFIVCASSLAFAGLAAGAWWLADWNKRADGSFPLLSSSTSKRFHPPGPPERPHIEISPDRQLKGVHHKDASGRSPLALVETPAGTVTIQRTFSKEGRLLKEEAFLGGKPVPVPRK